MHGELLKLRFEVAQSTVSKYIVRRQRPPSESWKTFLTNHAAGVVAMVLFVVSPADMRLLFGLVRVRVERRMVVFTAVTAHPTAEWLARQITDAFPWDSAPEYLIRDRDGSYGPVFRRRLHAMGIRDRPTAPRLPSQNCYAERLIGSIRRDCLGHLIVFGDERLRRILVRYADYYNRTRTHLSLANDAPASASTARKTDCSTTPTRQAAPSLHPRRNIRKRQVASDDEETFSSVKRFCQKKVEQTLCREL